MLPLVTSRRTRARNLLMSTPELNSESSGRSSAVRSTESFCGGWDAEVIRAEGRKHRLVRVSRTARRQRQPSAGKWRQRGSLVELGLGDARVIFGSFLFFGQRGVHPPSRSKTCVTD